MGPFIMISVLAFLLSFSAQGAWTPSFQAHIKKSETVGDLLFCSNKKRRSSVCDNLSKTEVKTSLENLRFEKDILILDSSSGQKLRVQHAPNFVLINDMEFLFDAKWSFADLRRNLSKFMDKNFQPPRAKWSFMNLAHADSNDHASILLGALIAEVSRIDTCEKASEFANTCTSKLEEAVRAVGSSASSHLAAAESLVNPLDNLLSGFAALRNRYSGFDLASCSKTIQNPLNRCIALARDKRLAALRVVEATSQSGRLFNTPAARLSPEDLRRMVCRHHPTLCPPELTVDPNTGTR